jgi:hydrogenase/urease accessory protein HupE
MIWPMLALMLWPSPPHDEKLSVSRLRVHERGADWVLDLPTEGLAKVVVLPAEVLDLEDEDLPALKEPLRDWLATSVKLRIDGKEVPFRMGSLHPLHEPHLASGGRYLAHVRATLHFDAPDEPRRLDVAAALFATLTDAHQAQLHVTWGGRTRPWRFAGPFELEIVREDVDPTFWGTVALFTLWGMEHIIIGFDHLAFLFALLIAARSLGELVRIVTSFTVAHSLTLLLAAMDVIRLAPVVTESLIAASIVYVAAENLLVREAKERWVLTFVFGLVHGVGFSSVLRERLAGLEGILLPVVSFNVGVELGQLAILLVVFPVLARLREAPDPAAARRRQRRLLVSGSVPALLLGLGWLVDRVFRLEWMPI